MNIRKIFGLLLAPVMFAFAGCSTSDDADSAGAGNFEIVGEKVNYNFYADEDMVFIPVRSNIPESEWRISTPDADWCHVARSYDNEKGLYLAVDSNEEVDVRAVTFTVGAGSKNYDIQVRQLGYGPAILVNSKVLDYRGGEFSIEVVSNIEVRMSNPQVDSDDEQWLEVRNSGLPLSRALAESEFSLYAYANIYPYARSAKVTFTAVDPMYMRDDITQVCTITQSTGTVSAEMSYPDNKVPNSYISVDSTQHHNGVDTDKLIDGDYSTVYHSPWGVGYDDPTTQFPVEWTFHFGGSAEPINISYFKLYSGTGNGRPGHFNVEYKLKGDEDWTRISNASNPNPTAEDPLYNFGQQGGIQICRFPSTLNDITDLHIIWYDGAGDNGAGKGEGFISSQEIEFYEDMSSTVNGQILKVFTDLSCSELNAGVTRADITELYQVSPYLAQEVAMRLYNGSYPENERQFRVGSYEAYSNGDALFTTFRTRRYTQHDNPTGVYAVPGQTLLVCVDHIPDGQTVSFGVSGENSDGYAARFSGFDMKVELFTGLNEVKPTTEGMCYIINTAANLTSASEPVKVHILPGSGRVEGYFDLRYHTDEDYVNMLTNTGAKYFVAKGKNMIFNMHTAALRRYAPTGIISGLTAWDDILGWQFELMGIAKQNGDGTWDRMIDETHFNNHMMAISNDNPSSYMDASDYRINFNSTSGIPKIISRELLLAAEDNTWGPAHEAGHVNQMAILWKSNAESSNNLFSNYAIYKFGKYGSRGSKIEDIANCFARGESWVEMGDATHMNESTEIHMRMNWQLWNYFHRCGVDPQFWPKLFGLLRTKYILPNEQAGYYGMIEDNGKCQIMFAKAVCEAAQMDFTDFFEVWGFLRPVDITYSQYGTARYNVTQAMIDELKAEMAKYPTKAPAIQYIEDRNVKDGNSYSELGYYTTFQQKATVSGTPTYTINNRTVKVDGATNGVAVEVRGPEGSDGSLGALRYFANYSSFALPASVSTTGMTVYVVQWDSKRIKATAK